MQYETNGFNRWQAAQLLVNRILLQNADTDAYITALKASLPALSGTDPCQRRGYWSRYAKRAEQVRFRPTMTPAVRARHQAVKKPWR